MRKLLLVFLALLALPAAQARAQEMLTICHSTGNAEPPYVTLTLTNDGVLEHVNHEDDLVPAPPGGCPQTVVVEPEDTPAPAATPGYAIPTATATPAPTPTPRPDRRERDRDDDGGAVRGGGSGGAAPAPAAQPSVSEPRTADVRHLPMTGAEMWLIAAAGLGLLLCGIGVRLRLPT